MFLINIVGHEYVLEYFHIRTLFERKNDALNTPLEILYTSIVIIHYFFLFWIATLGILVFPIAVVVGVVFFFLPFFIVPQVYAFLLVNFLIVVGVFYLKRSPDGQKITWKNLYLNVYSFEILVTSLAGLFAFYIGSIWTFSDNEQVTNLFTSLLTPMVYYCWIVVLFNVVMGIRALLLWKKQQASAPRMLD